MQITKDAVVSFHYTLNDSEGRVLDSSEGREAFAYIHGAGMIVPGLEEHMEGKTSGTSLKVEVAPAKGYGEMDPQLLQKVPVDRFGGQTVEAGMQFQTPENHVFTVMEVSDTEVLLNGKPARLAPGARIRDTGNLLVMSGALVNLKLPVNYTLEHHGMLLDIWVLRDDERARQPWPRTPAEAQAWMFDPAAQSWTKP